jgi:hypothetical protein
LVDDIITYFTIILSQLLFVQDQVQGKQQHQKAVTNITKHDGEQKGEGYNRKETRVDFTITGHTIGVDDGLETFSEFVGAVISRGCLLGAEFSQDTK